MKATGNDSLLDEQTPHQLIDEIKQITEQYSREVTTARRTWPKSVRDRVLALARLGVARSRIGKECGIPAATIFLWCGPVIAQKRRAKNAAVESQSVHDAAPPAQGRFLALPAKSESDCRPFNPTVGMEIQLESRLTPTDSEAGLQIILPGGIEVRGLTSLDQVLALYRGFRA